MDTPPPIPAATRPTSSFSPDSGPSNGGPRNNRKRSAPSPNRPLPSSNPSMVPQAPKVAKTSRTEGTEPKLIVVLSQACLETYKVSSGGGGGRGGKGDDRDAKYTLLNCDDHQGILAKMGREIAGARPDITHQVRQPSPTASSQHSQG